MHQKLFAFAFCAVALAPFESSAQQSGVGPAVTDPGTSVPALKYESAFTRYLPFRDEKLVPWRDVNDEVARVGGQSGILGGAGGHAGHASKPAAKPSVPAAPAHGAPGMMQDGAHQGMKR